MADRASNAAIAAIVEGHGETEAVPVLVRRIAQRLDPTLAIAVKPVLRVPHSRLARPGEIERTIELAARRNGGKGWIQVRVLRGFTVFYFGSPRFTEYWRH